MYSENENNIKENDNLRAVRQENEAEIQDLNSEVSDLNKEVIIYFYLFTFHLLSDFLESISFYIRLNAF